MEAELCHMREVSGLKDEQAQGRGLRMKRQPLDTLGPSGRAQCGALQPRAGRVGHDGELHEAPSRGALPPAPPTAARPWPRVLHGALSLRTAEAPHPETGGLGLTSAGTDFGGGLTGLRPSLGGLLLLRSLRDPHASRPLFAHFRAHLLPLCPPGALCLGVGVG